MASKAQVLVQLLDKIPNADELQRLLEPETLFYLMQQYGHSREDVQQRLDKGELPEALLLELLQEEPSVYKLFVLLSDQMDTRVEKRVDLDEIIRQGRLKKEAMLHTTPKVTPVVTIEVTAPMPDITPRSTQPVSIESPSIVDAPVTEGPKKSRLIENHGLSISVIIVTLTSIIPAVILAGVLSTSNLVPFIMIALCVTVIGGAIAGTLFSQVMDIARERGVLLGILLNMGVLAGALIYCLEHPSFSSFELMLPVVLGSVPALILYMLIGRKTRSNP